MRLEGLYRQLKTNKLGVIVLGLGMMAIIAVGWLAYHSLWQSADERRVKISKDEISSFKTQVQQNREAAEEKKTYTYKRQTSISENQIIGSWSARLEEGQALLQLKEGTYRLIIVRDNPVLARRYSNGTYQLQEDVLILYPNPAWGAPKSERYKYDILTRARMPVLVSRQAARMIFQLPGDDVDIYVPNYHPLLELAKDKIAVWDVLK